MAYDETKISLELIRRAQQGSKECLSTLAESVRADLLVYLRRLTLDSHLAEDLCQDTLVEMIRHLPRLEIASHRAFWGWLYKTALSRVCRLPRKRRKADGGDSLEGLPDSTERTPPGLLMQRELTEAVCEAVAMLKVSQRSVVTLRCFDQLSYAEIAAITGGTQMQAKLRFFRAKQALKRHLRRTGFRESHLLTALGLFATLTAKSVRAGASIHIEAVSLEVGLGTMVVGWVVSKVGLTVAACIALALISATGTPSGDHSAAALVPMGKQIIKDPGYVYPASVVAAYDPDAGGWLAVVSTPQGQITQSSNIEDILIDERSLPGRCLLLPAGHWVQVRFPVPIVDGPDVDLFLTGYGLAQKPLVTLIGPDGQRLDLVPTTSTDQPSGFTVTAYDLSDVVPTFTPYEVRITGTGSSTDSTPFALRMIRAGL